MIRFLLLALMLAGCARDPLTVSLPMLLIVPF